MTDQVLAYVVRLEKGYLASLLNFGGTPEICFETLQAVRMSEQDAQCVARDLRSAGWAARAIPVPTHMEEAQAWIARAGIS